MKQEGFAKLKGLKKRKIKLKNYFKKKKDII